MSSYAEVLEKSAKVLNPALVANYIYELVKEYNYFYQNYPILKADYIAEKEVRLALTQWTGNVIKWVTFTGNRLPKADVVKEYTDG